MTARSALHLGVALALCVGLAAPVHADITPKVVLKTAPLAPGGYFDPHNHFGGILPYRTLGAISVQGQRALDQLLRSQDGLQLKALLNIAASDPSGDQKVRDIVLRYIAHHHVAQSQHLDRSAAGPLLEKIEAALLESELAEMKSQKKQLASAEERMASGTQVVDRLLACDIKIDGATDPRGRSSAIKHLLQQMLTATPEQDFDSAYVARALINVPALDQVRATLAELHSDQIHYVELSHPIAKFKAGAKPYLLDAQVSRLLRDAEQHDGTQVRWLPMLVTTMLAQAGPEAEGLLPVSALNRDTGTCEVAPIPSPLAPLAGDLEAVLGDPLVVGFDMASPERSCYTEAGGQNLVRALQIAYQVAVAKRKRLVAHVHVGEGFPAFGRGQVSCEAPQAAGDLVPFPVKYQDGVPVHYRQARANIGVLLTAIQGYRAELARGHELARFDDHVVIRFGHATHASAAQARQMKALHVWADVNLTSNLATGALLPGGASVVNGAAIGDAIADATPDERVGNLALLARNAKNARLFKDHALVPLLQAGVLVVLGTDGGGVEHSSMPGEYALAAEVLRTFDKRLKMETLYRNQRRHYEFISGSPAGGAR